MVDASSFVTLLEELNRRAGSPTLLETILIFIAIGLVMVPLEYLNSRRRKSRRFSNQALLNLVYWFFNPLVIRPFTNVVLIGCLVALSFIVGQIDLPSMLEGYGPIARQPLWLQIVEMLLLADLIEYWVHRGFHCSRYWKFHAIHHTAIEMNWLASARMHPVNDLCTKVCQVLPLLAVGFPVQTAALVVPYLFLYVIFLHANIDWKFGIFSKVLVSPAYHHWHHSSEAEAIDKNFAGIFPIWDMLFGTYYMPEHLPSRYGLVEQGPDENLLHHMLYPFAPDRGPNAENAVEHASQYSVTSTVTYPAPIEQHIQV